jgi:hypothetical protein
MFYHYDNTLLYFFTGKLPGKIQDLFREGSEDRFDRWREVSTFRIHPNVQSFEMGPNVQYDFSVATN